MNIGKSLLAAILGASSVAILALCCAPRPMVLAQATGAPAAAARLEVTGAVKTPLALSIADLKAMPRKTMRVNGQNGQAAQVYEGVALSEILQRAGVPQGGDQAGPWMAAYIVAGAADGYRVVFSLAELNAGIGGVEVLVADTLDGAPLAEGQGPFRLVVPSDKRAARWVRMLQSVRVDQAAP
jgi:DMSO/TMAO reductase YedYZ molybdopterin-dependent catalytic subunit